MTTRVNPTIVKFMSGNVLDFELLYQGRIKNDWDPTEHYANYYYATIVPLLKQVRDRHDLRSFSDTCFKSKSFIHAPNRIARALAEKQVEGMFFGKEKELLRWQSKLQETISYLLAAKPSFADYLVWEVDHFIYPAKVMEVREVKV
ncbi:MAG: hypothetical protein GY833_21790 [Aestuariibacter sp.]|nr:hypothetical protein [Aestuariibacter sp.]